MSLNSLIEYLQKIDLAEAEWLDRGQGLSPLLDEFVFELDFLPDEEKIKRIHVISDYYNEVYNRSNGNVKRAYEATRKKAMMIYVQHWAKKMDKAAGLGESWNANNSKVNESPDKINPEEFLFKNNPDLEHGGIVHQAHKPENVILVWWFNPSTAEFVSSKDPNHVHMLDYCDKINPAEEKQWVRGRVFKSGDKVFVIIYNLRGMSEYARWDVIAKISSAIEPITVSTILDVEGKDISNLFEGTCYKLTPSKSGYWRVIEGVLSESQHSRHKCMECDTPPTVEVRWAEGMGHAWFCAKCFEAWKKEHRGDIDAEKKITDGEASKNFSDNKNPNIWEAGGLFKPATPEQVANRPKPLPKYTGRYKFDGLGINDHEGLGEAFTLNKLYQAYEVEEDDDGLVIGVRDDNGTEFTMYWGDFEEFFEDIQDLSVSESKDRFTAEMIKHYEDRTRRHIGLVQAAAKKIIEHDPEFKDFDATELANSIEKHDQSKFEEPEYTPYVRLTWNKKIGQSTSDPEMNNATLHHVKNNSHHPEYWSKENANIDPNDRNKSLKCIDASKMPDVCVAEMCADWEAMSQELGTNTARQWFEKCKDVRWHFSDHQVELIDRLLKVFEGEKDNE